MSCLSTAASTTPTSGPGAQTGSGSGRWVDTETGRCPRWQQWGRVAKGDPARHSYPIPAALAAGPWSQRPRLY